MTEVATQNTGFSEVYVQSQRNRNLYWSLGFLMNLPFLVTLVIGEITGSSIIYALIFIALTILSLGKRIYTNAVLSVVLTLILTYLIDFIFFKKTEYSTYKFGMFVFKIPFLILIPFLAQNHIRTFFKGYFTSLLLLSLILSYISFQSTGPSTDYDRLEIGILNPIWISRLAIEAFIIAWVILKLKTKYLLLFFASIMPIIYLSGSKGPIVSLMAASIIYIWDNHSIWTRKTKVALVLTFVLAILAVFVAIKNDSFKSNSFFQERFLTLLHDKAEHNGVENRNEIWPNTIDRLTKQDLPTILLGAGVGNFSYLYTGSYNNNRTYPHNILLEVITENGILFFIILTLIICSYYRKHNNNIFKYLFLYFLWNSFFSGDTILNQMVFFYLGCMGIPLKTNWLLIPKFSKRK